MIYTFENAREEHLNDIVRIWHEGWIDAHAAIAPAELTNMRTIESLETRANDRLDLIRVMMLDGQVAAFHMIKNDELDQFFVDRAYRGKGTARALMADVESVFSENNIKTAWLACAIGNERAAAFYRKAGWHFMRVMLLPVHVESGSFILDIWRFEKQIV
ncbi:GNAT family N-acetyltransferase [Ahrensia kielensis]|uniref:GNAT family N-acetyltransferase n=1 Tax=Ahrensia kielensis TaxID=76980 RepID=A0ABU9T3L4_9HYPH